MTATLLLMFLAFVVLAVGISTFRYLPRPAAIKVLAGMTIWLIYVGLLSYSGVVRDPANRPPGAMLIIVPVIVFVFAVLVRSSAGARVAIAFPIWLVMGLQFFRVGVELLLHRIWLDGLAPRMLTFEGGNIDIFIGLSAPLIAWISTTGRTGQRLALGWNMLGLLALANVVIRAALTAPGPLNVIHAEIPNLAVGTFPFTYIAGFFAPLAVVLHVLAIRALRTSLIGTPDTAATRLGERRGPSPVKRSF